MIADAAIEKAAALKESSERLFKEYPSYQLDFSWPSIGVLDLLLTPLRGRNDLNRPERDLISACAAYVGIIAFDCWSRLPDRPKVRLLVQGEKEREVILQAEGGSYLNGVYTIPITTAVETVLRDPRVFPYFEKAISRSNGEGNILSRLALGVITGLSPFGHGGWERLSGQDAALQLCAAEKFLSERSASYYQRNFGGEFLGAEPAIYRENLILPPSGHEEEFYALRGSAALARLLLERGVSRRHSYKLALNLAYFPDEQISACGAALAAALSAASPDPLLQVRLGATAELRAKIRPAVVAVRKLFGLPHDWIRLAEEERLADAHSVLAAELALGLLPLWRSPKELLGRAELRPLFFSIGQNDASAALLFIEELSDAKITAALTPQKILLLLCTGRLEQAELELSKLNEADSEKGELGGVLKLLIGDFAGAAAQLGHSRAEAEDDLKRCRVTEELVLALSLAGEYQAVSAFGRSAEAGGSYLIKTLAAEAAIEIGDEELRSVLLPELMRCPSAKSLALVLSGAGGAGSVQEAVEALEPDLIQAKGKEEA